ncbi:lipase maturation factor family protein [Haloarcula sp. Atlit-47R]|uniref:lipase maturation factor family protein n=1 Tax=Haloarcula sp. Atlit-47R TaxID=2282132 RepID=UPI000EF202D9|nr:lipase maturation factor family protein [Haloarcula sp. Atlit-47R]RLM46929.1 lipase maturation factor family protein [Haloarcula sp. Atlit-47R]
MLPWEPAAYWLVRMLFHRALAVIYLLAFVVAATQFRPLAGEDGLLPIQQYVDRYEFRDRPSLFYVYPNDRVIGITAWAGVGLSALALVGVPSWLPRPYAVPVSILLWLLLWALYLSFVNAGRTFYGYGWESMLLETGFLAAFLGAGTAGPPVAVVWLLKWVLFRNMFGAGLIKLRGDDCWRDLTALDYHYETQPIPNPVSWYAHHLPDRFHRLEVLGNHVVEVAVPFLYFAPQPWASVAGVATIGFQGWLMLTGNFSWLNALTIVQAIAAFRDDVFTATLPVTAPSATAPPLYLQALSVGLAAVVLWRSVGPVRNILSERQVMNTAFDSLRLVNAYGAFGSITRTRYEIVVQGTTDEVVTADTEWETYEFKGKPTDPAQRPRQLAPYHYRLDWQLWFAAMTSSPRRSPWFLALLDRLLAGDEATEKLLASVPFSETTPTHVRAVRYRYRFTTPEERRETGQWWERERVGTYVSPISDGDLRLADV